MNEQAAAFEAWANSYSQDRVYDSAEGDEIPATNGEGNLTPEYSLTPSVKSHPRKGKQ